MKTSGNKLSVLVEALADETISVLFEEKLEPRDVIDGVEIYYFTDLMSALLPKEKRWSLSYDEQTELMNDWTKKNDAHYYSWSGDSFERAIHEDKAVREAIEAGKNKVVIEFLS